MKNMIVYGKFFPDLSERTIIPVKSLKQSTVNTFVRLTNYSILSERLNQGRNEEYLLYYFLGPKF